jgi:hypothetical protein
MTILNTYQCWPSEGVFVLLCVTTAACFIAAIIALVEGDEVAQTGFVIAFAVACFLAMLVYCGTERVERHKIYANELTYSEVLEKYNVIETEGLIITVEEKEPSAQ